MKNIPRTKIPYQLEDADHIGLIRKGNVLYFSHELDAMYFEHGARLHRDLFLNGLNMVHRRPMINTTLPSTGRVSLLHQASLNRYVVHLLFASPIKRGNCEVIEDLVPLYDVPVTIDVPKKITSAVLVPSMKKLPMDKKDNKIEVIIPKFSCHCAIVFNYE